MKYCNCGNQIPRRIKVDGKDRNLTNRTKCLKCLPFGERVHAKLTPDQARSKSALKMKNWLRKQREELGIDVIKAIRQKRKTDLVNAIGGGCQLCGYDKVLKSLAFHHTRDKLFTLDERRFQYSMKKVLDEVLKCVLVCHNCHGEIHAGIIDPVLIARANEHVVGVVSGYDLHTLNNCNRCGKPCARSFCPDCNPMKKAEWPRDEEFILEVQRTSGAFVAKRIGVSDTVVLNRYHKIMARMSSKAP
jgi:hypothetical protein